MSDDQRIRGVYIEGKPRSGKSETLARWAVDDIRAGRGLVFIDPTGQTAATVLERVPPGRREDVIWFAPHEYPIPFNILAGVPAARRSYLANSVVDTVKQLFDIDFRASNIEMFVRAAILVLLETPGSTLMGLNYLLTSPEYRRRMLENVRDPIVRDFWDRTFGEHMTDREQRDRTISTLAKVFQLVSDPIINRCIGQRENKLDFGAIIARKQIFIASLPEGELSPIGTAALGSFIISRLNFAAAARSEFSVFPVYIDRFEDFSPLALRACLRSWPSLGMSLVLAHRHLGEIDDKLRTAIFGNLGTQLAFTTSPFDADIIAKLFTSNVKPDDLIKLNRYRAYASIEGHTVDLHMPPLTAKRWPGAPAAIRRNCRSVYSNRPLEAIDAEIAAYVASTAESRAPLKEPEPVKWTRRQKGG